MQLPLQVTFRHMETAPALEAKIREGVAELERFSDRIVSCRVAVECRHPRRQQGNLFRVRIDLKVPGREIVIGRDPAKHHEHENSYVAMRDALAAARRALEDYNRQLRGEVKMHDVPDHGHVARLLAERDCGFIEDRDGRETYFHRNSVANGGFDRLRVGDMVRFVAQYGESPAGPQASTVVPLKRRLPPVEKTPA